MRVILILLACVFSVLILVNEIAAPQISAFEESKCTRYCHNVVCKHQLIKHGDAEHGNLFWKVMFSLYRKNILMLRENPLGLTYEQMNLLVYVIIVPAIALLLLINLLRKNYG
ncbi:hypothetical protein [Aureibacter tunicatorum]|uniref:Uncharacterized protein n=1 Tax=Aureibacter tunicatorum TaxID=866807 RepID=A0AAE3XPR3_9BACT|nr:hypothetical protein [Aureibacter tunicatorum]MDR6240423.1 hypothetical protein [Aureibacter tunicatorum]BDD05698.1 hypothetical protein AUTU_31810 [Aureibacter tunicatorum]